MEWWRYFDPIYWLWRLRCRPKRKEKKLNPYSLLVAMSAIVSALLLFLSGCANLFTAGTDVNYEAEGIKASYSSHKNQENFKAHVTFDRDGRVNGLNIETNATTPEAAIAASSAAILKALQLAEEALARAPAPGGGISFPGVRGPGASTIKDDAPLLSTSRTGNKFGHVTPEYQPLPIYDCGLYLQQCQRERYVPERVSLQ